MTLPHAGLVLLLVAVATGTAACPRAGAPTYSVRLGDSDIVLQVEVAADPEARRIGLSGRDALASDGSMLFIFPDPQMVVFWMKGVPFDIDVAFLDEDASIFQIERMRAEDLTHHRSSQPARYALELAPGVLRNAGVIVGDTIPLPREIKDLPVR